MKPLSLPLFLLFIISFACKDVDEPNVDLRIFYSVGDCFPGTDPFPIAEYSPYTGSLQLAKDRLCAGILCDFPTKQLRVYRGVLRISLEPADYILTMDEPRVQSRFFTVKADSVSAGAMYFRKCTSY